MEFQTRSDETGIMVHPSLKDAFKAAQDDPSIWKISFTIPETQERIRLIAVRDGGWVYESMEQVFDNGLINPEGKFGFGG